jgi:hypothetical protein
MTKLSTISNEQNVIDSGGGLVCDKHWKPFLESCSVDLFLRLRRDLYHKIEGLTEKFNKQSKYFGYSVKEGSDVLYIYIQKENLRVDLRIDRKHETSITQAGFKIQYADNFQGRADWLTGWQIPQDTKQVDIVIKWLLKAFEKKDE